MLRVLKILLPLLILGVTLLPSPVTALGLGIAPGKLDFRVRAGSTEVKTLNVINQSEQEADFQLYTDDKYQEWLSLSPAEFRLPPGQSQAVEVTVAPPLTAANEHDLLIYVVSTTPGSELQIGAGVKVPTHIKVLEFPFTLIIGAGIAFVLLVLLIGMLLRRKRRAADA